jgi:hypothetical protein
MTTEDSTDRIEKIARRISREQVAAIMEPLRKEMASGFQSLRDAMSAGGTKFATTELRIATCEAELTRLRNRDRWVQQAIGGALITAVLGALLWVFGEMRQPKEVPHAAPIPSAAAPVPRP